MPRPKCSQCCRPISSCYCAEIQPQDNHWPIWILQHPNEAKHPIGTARIAHLSLNNSQLMSATKVSEQAELAQAIVDSQPLVVFPSKNSIPLSEIEPTPRPLIFIDATWRKAKRILHESPELNHLTHVHLTETPKSRYTIRKAPALSSHKSAESEVPNALSTLEAIVYCLNELEQTQDKYQPLLNTMDWVINHQIQKMGKNVFEENYRKD